jgi:hypothetical protein
MKSKKRFVLGLFATLLLSVGLTRAADRLDPLSKTNINADAATAVADDCEQTCRILDDEER